MERALHGCLPNLFHQLWTWFLCVCPLPSALSERAVKTATPALPFEKSSPITLMWMGSSMCPGDEKSCLLQLCRLCMMICARGPWLTFYEVEISFSLNHAGSIHDDSKPLLVVSINSRQLFSLRMHKHMSHLLLWLTHTTCYSSLGRIARGWQGNVATFLRTDAGLPPRLVPESRFVGQAIWEESTRNGEV